MTCYICQTAFGAAGDCPGICRQSTCQQAAKEPGKWAEFLAAKEAAVIAAMRAPGATYIHMTPREN